MSNASSPMSGPHGTGATPKADVHAVLHDSPSILWPHLLFAALSAGAVALLTSEPRWSAPSFALDLLAALPLVGPVLAVQCLRPFQHTRVRVDFAAGGIGLFRQRMFGWPIRIGEVESYHHLVLDSRWIVLLTRRGRDTLALELPNNATPETLLLSTTQFGAITHELRFHVRLRSRDWWGLRAFPLVLMLFMHMFGGAYGSIFSWGSIISEMLYFGVGLPVFGIAWLGAYIAGFRTLQAKWLVLGPVSVSSPACASIRYADIRQVNEGTDDLVIVYQSSRSGFDEEWVRFGPHAPGPLRAQAIALALRAAADQAKLPCV